MTNPFHKYREQVARAMCSQFHNDDEDWLSAREDVRDLWRNDATTALDALWNAMQAEGSVRAGVSKYDELGALVEYRNLNTQVREFEENTPCLIIRTEPTA